MKRQRRLNSAKITRRLAPFAKGASGPIDFESRAQSNFIGAGFRQCYVSTEVRMFLLALHGGSSTPLFMF